MKKINKFIFIIPLLLVATKSFAVCPLCVVALAGGIELAKILKINDIITGAWIGGLIVALIYWTIDVLNKKNINFKAKNLITIIFWYILVFASLNWIGIYSKQFLNIPYLNQINLGILIGSFGFWFAAELHNYLKEKNNGKSYFPFQKVILPVGFILILSLIFYFLI